MAVDVGGEAYVGVSQKVLHKPGVYTLPQQERGARMPQVVEAGLLGQFCTLEQSLEGAGDLLDYPAELELVASTFGLLGAIHEDYLLPPILPPRSFGWHRRLL